MTELRVCSNPGSPPTGSVTLGGRSKLLTAVFSGRVRLEKSCCCLVGLLGLKEFKCRVLGRSYVGFFFSLPSFLFLKFTGIYYFYKIMSFAGRWWHMP